MKNPKLKLRRKAQLRDVRKIKKELTDIVDDCLKDIRWYIVDDLISYLKKKGIVYAQKDKKKNSKKKKKK